MDETPFYWEYLPRKVVTKKLTSKSCGWKRGYNHLRSTIVLATTADGQILRPSLILKRQTEYRLKRPIDINMLILNSINGWMNKDLMIIWLEEVLFPCVKTEPCLLLVDSYEARMTDKVIAFLSKHKNIELGIIVGGNTDKIQPLDNGVNKSFKDSCRRKAIEYTNAFMQVVQEINAFQDLTTQVSQNLIQGKYVFLILIYYIVNNQIVMAEKDLNKIKVKEIFFDSGDFLETNC